MKTIIAILILILSILVVSADTSETQIIGTITVLEPETTPTPTPTQTLSSGGSSGGSSSSGSSGGGVIIDEDFNNIESHCSEEKDLKVGYSTTFTLNCNPVYEAVLSETESEYYIALRVDNLKAKSNKTLTQPDGEVYKYINIYVGTKRYNNSEIKFKVPVSWTTDKYIQMLIYKDGTWKSLPTTIISVDSEYVYYSAKTNHFSNFVIVGNKISISILPEVTPFVTETVEPTPTLTEPIPITTPEPSRNYDSSLSLILIGLLFVPIIIIVLLIISYIIFRNNK